MQSEEADLRMQITLGWVLLLLVVALMLLVMIVHSAHAKDGFAMLQRDPGPRGVRMLIGIFALYALVPLFINATARVAARALGWMAITLAVLAFLYFLLHHIAHWYAGDRPDFNSHVLDLVHSIVALWLIFTSIRWSRVRTRTAT